MCVAIAGRIGRVVGTGVARRAVVEVGGTEREIGLALVPEAVPGDWVVFHSGYAVRVVPEREVAALNALLAGE